VIDARGVLAFLAATESEPGINLHSLLVKRAGETVVEAYWAPYTPDDRPLVYSMSKTFTGTAMGYAVAEGRIALTDRIVDHLAGSVPEPISDRTAAQTVHHVLSMSTGHTLDTLDAMFAGGNPDLTAAYLSIEPQRDVGSCHVYNNGASWLLGELTRRATGETLMDYLRPRLFEPLGIAPTWDVDPLGRELGLTGVHATTREISALAEAYRTRSAVLPEGWVDLASTRHIATDPAAEREWTYGYGYQVWMCREGYRADGAYGQYAVILDDMTICITSAVVTMQPIMDLVWTHLVPAVRAEGGEPAAAAKLGERLASLELRRPKDAGVAGPWDHRGPLVSWPSLAVGADQMNLPDLRDVTLVRDGHGWALRFTSEGVTHDLASPSGAWHRTALQMGAVTVPVALAVGTLSTGAARIHLAFTDTCHVLRIELGPRGGRYAWETSPLSYTSLSQMGRTC
jgi:CubicO group peptidase (beta-lactamase class C family)